MTEVPAAAPAPASTEPKPNSFARILGVFFSPGETFASIARRPDWVVPLLVLIVISVISGAISAPRVDWAAPAREQMESNPNIPKERLEQSEKMAAAFGRVAAYAAPVFVIIIMLIVTVVLWLAFRLFGGEGNFLQAWSATLYAWFPEVIKSILGAIIMVVKGGPFTPFDLETIVRSNPAFLVSVKEQPVLFSLLTNVDIFGIWTLILFIIAFKHVARVSTGKSAAVIVPLRIVTVLFGLIGPALQSLRK